jgi:hypothetical protein
MMLSPLKWPHMWLPLKRKAHRAEGFPQVAVLGTATSDPAQEMEVHINQNIFGDPIGDVEIKKYKNVDAVLDDGWKVD